MSQTSLKIRVVPRYPAKIGATDGIKAVRSGVDLVVKSDYSNLVPVPTVNNPDRTFMLAWDSDLDNYQSMSFTNIINNIQDAVIGPPLAAIDAANPGANQAIVFTDIGAATTYTVSNYMRSISNATDQPAFLSSIGAATSAQGGKADTALQPGQAATPTQGAKADTALQPTDSRHVLWSGRLEVLDIPDYSNDHRLNLVVLQADPLDYASANLNRSSGITGGVGGSINSTVRIQNTVYNSDAYDATNNPLGKGSGYNGYSYEWGMSVLLDNGRTVVGDDGYRGQNGGLLVRARKMAAGVGGTWGMNIIGQDWPGLSNPTQLTCAAEFDVHADGTDANSVRFGISSFIKSTTSTDANPNGYGEGWAAFVAMPDPGKSAIASGDWKAKWKTGFYAAGPMDVAFDAADASNQFATTPFSTPIALRMNFKQQIAFSPQAKHTLRAETSGNKLVWAADAGSGIADMFSVDAYGNFVYGAGAPTVISNWTWGRVVSLTSAAFQLSGGNVDFRATATNTIDAELGTWSNHVVVFRMNSQEIFRLTSAGIVMATGKTITTGNGTVIN